MLVFVGVVLLALNLRTAVAAISPIVDLISAELTLDPVALGVLGATPPLAFAASGLIGPMVVRRVGLERALVLFEEGVEHVRAAEKILAAAELRVEELLGQGERMRPLDSGEE